MFAEAGEDDSLLADVKEPHLTVHLRSEAPDPLLDGPGLVRDPRHVVSAAQLPAVITATNILIGRIILEILKRLLHPQEFAGKLKLCKTDTQLNPSC